MPWAIKNDKSFMRFINSVEDLAQDEYASETPVEIGPSEEELINRFKSAIQKHMDDTAVAAGYDDLKSAVTYAEEPAVPKFQEEGQALRAWRSLVWAYGYEQIKAVQSGEREMPTVEELITELPALVMP